MHDTLAPHGASVLVLEVTMSKVLNKHRDGIPAGAPMLSPMAAAPQLADPFPTGRIGTAMGQNRTRAAQHH